ncbi:MAG TPA: diguanylate cyclase, partial [Anaeromyxobacteraceae bacterium]
MRPSAGPAPFPRAPLGSARETRARLLGQRPRPLLVALHAALLGEVGLLGRPARRRSARRLSTAFPAAAAAAVGALLLGRTFAAEALGWPQAAGAALLLAALGVAWRRARPVGREATAREQIELGALGVLAAFAVAQLGEGSGPPGESPLYPVVYLGIAALVAYLRRSAGLAVAG